jgi:glycosyltransferase involved in cell wall biosynthesis
MKILHIIESAKGGTLTMCQLLADAQKREGHDVYIIFGKRGLSDADIQSEFSEPVRFDHIDVKSFWRIFRSTLKIRRYYKSLNPDVVILHSSIAGFLGRISAWGALPKATKLIYVPHCISLMREDIGNLTKFVFLAFEWIAGLKSSSVVACSQSEKQVIEKMLPFSNVILIENAVDEKGINSNEDRVSPKQKVVIFAGRLTAQKDPESFARITALIKKKHPDLSVTWIGDGDEGYHNSVAQAGADITGWLPKDEVQKKLNAASIYLTTAKWEGMPVGVIEAFYNQTVVVASNCAGNKDVISHGVTGFLFENDLEAVGYIERLLREPELAKQIRRKAKAVAIKRFSVERYISEFAKFY